MIPSPTELGYFLEVAQTQNLSRAAERIGIAQPTLSLAMQKLERAIGAPLFLRTKRGIVLTRPGQLLQAHARDLLQSWNDIKSRALASATAVQGAFTIGCHPSIARSYLMQVLPDLMAAHPHLDISLSHDLSRNVTNDIITMKTDIGIVVNPVPHPDLVIRPLSTDRVGLWVNADTPFDTQIPGKPTSVLICDQSLLQVQSLIRQLQAKNLQIPRIIQSNNLGVIADLTVAGAGIGILPALVALRARRPLRMLPKMPVFSDEHCLVYRVEHKHIKGIQAIATAIEAAATSLA